MTSCEITNQPKHAQKTNRTHSLDHRPVDGSLTSPDSGIETGSNRINNLQNTINNSLSLISIESQYQFIKLFKVVQNKRPRVTIIKPSAVVLTSGSCLHIIQYKIDQLGMILLPRE